MLPPPASPALGLPQPSTPTAVAGGGRPPASAKGPALPPAGYAATSRPLPPALPGHFLGPPLVPVSWGRLPGTGIPAGEFSGETREGGRTGQEEQTRSDLSPRSSGLCVAPVWVPSGRGGPAFCPPASVGQGGRSSRKESTASQIRRGPRRGRGGRHGQWCSLLGGAPALRGGMEA